MIELVWNLEQALDGLSAAGVIPPDQALTADSGLQAAGAVLSAIQQHAPDLLASTVPPDPQVWFSYYTGSHEWIASSDVKTNSYDWNLGRTLGGVAPGAASVGLMVYDDDLLEDDVIGGFLLDQAYLRSVDGCGPLVLRGSITNPIDLLVIEVEGQ